MMQNILKQNDLKLNTDMRYSLLKYYWWKYNERYKIFDYRQSKRKTLSSFQDYSQNGNRCQTMTTTIIIGNINETGK